MTNPTPADVERLIAEAKAALEGVTDGPWKQGKEHPYRVSRQGTYIANCDPLHCNHPVTENNARFIAWARNNVPALIAALRAMQAEKSELALDVLAASGQAQEAYEAQLAAEATVATLTAQVEAMRGALERRDALIDELCTSVDCAAEGIGGQRGALTIIRDLAALTTEKNDG